MLRETTSRGQCELVCPSRTNERGGGILCERRRGTTQSLKTFLRALPSIQYYDIEKCMVGTDGSLRLRRKKEEGETMGAGVA